MSCPEQTENDQCVPTKQKLLQVGIIKDPLAGPWTTWKILCVIYLLLFSAYWLYNLIHVGAELKTAADIHQFTTTKLGLSERQLQTVSWPNIARRLVEVHSRTLGFLKQYSSTRKARARVPRNLIVSWLLSLAASYIEAHSFNLQPVHCLEQALSKLDSSYAAHLIATVFHHI